MGSTNGPCVTTSVRASTNVIVAGSRIASEPSGFLRLARLHQELSQYADTDIYVDFAQVAWIDAHLAARSGGVLVLGNDARPRLASGTEGSAVVLGVKVRQETASVSLCPTHAPSF